MDDICTGADSVEESLLLKSRLVHNLAQFGLELKKWTSNSDEQLATFETEDRASDQCHLTMDRVYRYKE